MARLDPFVYYYQRELQHLRQATAGFAKRYPKIAARLEMGTSETPDPHVERLIESFAFLAARLQRDIDDKFPQITSAILDILYPHFSAPLPSMSVVQFAVNPDLGKITVGQEVPKGTKLNIKATNERLCRFQTCYDTVLWPLTITRAKVVPRDALSINTANIKTQRLFHLRIKTLDENISSYDIQSLRFYIDGDFTAQNAAYEMLFSGDHPVFAVPDKHRKDSSFEPFYFSPLRRVGFDQKEAVIPTARESHPSYRLLFEYFNFPEKFIFFDIENIKTTDAKDELDIYIPIPDAYIMTNISFSELQFKLGCTPIVNIFSAVSEPIKLDYRQREYKLVGDHRNEDVTEVHTIKKVFKTAPGGEPEELTPYYSYDHSAIENKQAVFWHSRRQESDLPHLEGTDVYMSFVDLEFDPQQKTDEVVYAEILCTNRAMARDIPRGGLFESEVQVPATCYCLIKPTNPVLPPQDGDTQWRLISQLCLNHLSLNSGEKSLDLVKEILRLYASVGHGRKMNDLHTLQSMKTRRTTRRFGDDAWRGFVQGLSITLTFSKKSAEEGGTFLFASILNEFFTLYAAVNSFIELSMTYEHLEGNWKTWEPSAGLRDLL